MPLCVFSLDQCLEQSSHLWVKLCIQEEFTEYNPLMTTPKPCPRLVWESLRRIYHVATGDGNVPAGRDRGVRRRGQPVGGPPGLL